MRPRYGSSSGMISLKNKDVTEGGMPVVASQVCIGGKAQRRLKKVSHVPIALLYPCIGLPSEEHLCVIQHTLVLPEFSTYAL